MMNAIKKFWKEEEGATMVEYAILVAFLGVVLIAVIQLLQGAVSGKFQEVTDSLNAAGGGS